MNNSRYFKIYDNGAEHGRFKSKTPKQAASKAFTSIIKGLDKTKKIEFSIRECTRGSKCKVFSYVGQKLEYDNPIEVTIGNKIVKFKHSNTIYRIYT